jgi:hypothetical protein
MAIGRRGFDDRLKRMADKITRPVLILNVLFACGMGLIMFGIVIGSLSHSKEIGIATAIMGAFCCCGAFYATEACIRSRRSGRCLFKTNR